MRRIFVLLLGICLILTLIPFSSAQARPPDRDRDGVPDRLDNCPRTAGSINNNGCPIEATQDPNDRDGDGNPDNADRCPNEGGPASNGGCPEGQTQPCPEGFTGANCEQPASTEAPQDPLPALPEQGRCMLATIGRARVNVREIPDISGAVVGQLEPAGVYPVHFHIMGANAEDEWFLVDAGWVSGTVVRLGGNCRHLPAVQLPEPRVLHIGDLGLIFVGGDEAAEVDFPTDQIPTDQIPPFLLQECDGSVRISWILQDFNFCDGSVMPTDQMPNEADGSVVECDGSVMPFDDFAGQGDTPLNGILIGLLLPAVKMGDGSVMPIDEFLGEGTIIPCVTPSDRFDLMLGTSQTPDGSTAGGTHGTGGGGGAGKVIFQDIHFTAVMDKASNFGLIMMILPYNDPDGVGDPFAPFTLNWGVPPDPESDWINLNGILIGLNQGDIYVCPGELAAGDGSVMPSTGFEEVGFNPQPDPPAECVMLNFTNEV